MQLRFLNAWALNAFNLKTDEPTFIRSEIRLRHGVNCNKDIRYPFPRGFKILQCNTRPPLLPPVMQGKAHRFQIRIHAIPCTGGLPLPRRLFTCPALADMAAAVRSVASRLCIDPVKTCSCYKEENSNEYNDG